MQTMNNSFGSLADMSFKFDQDTAKQTSQNTKLVKDDDSLFDINDSNVKQVQEKELAKIKSSASLVAVKKSPVPPRKQKYQHPKPLKQVLNYRFIKTIGQGSMGKVKLAEHNETKELVAIKIIPRYPDPQVVPHNFEYDPKADERVMLEAFALRLIDHPFIVKCLDFLATKDYFYVVTEYVQGVNMLDYLNHCDMNEDTARQIIRQLVSALDYCHQNNIVHRDLKMENIMLDTSNDKDDTVLKRLSTRRKSDGKDSKYVRIKLLDFGLANFYHNDRLLSTSCGSLYYAAPELLKSKNYIGPELDVWSLGVCAYTLICGRVPFDGPNIFSLRSKIMTGSVDYPENMSEDCVDLLNGMLQVDPKQRSSLDEIKNAKWLQSSMQVLPKFKEIQKEDDFESGSVLSGFMRFLSTPSKAQIKRRASNILNYVTNQSKAIKNFLPSRVRLKDLAGQNPDPRIISILTNEPVKVVKQFDQNHHGSIHFDSIDSFGFGFDKLEVDLALRKAIKSNGVLDDPIISTYYLLHEWFHRHDRRDISTQEPLIQKLTEFSFLLESSDDTRICSGNETEKTAKELSECLYRSMVEHGFVKNVTTFSRDSFVSEWKWEPSYVTKSAKQCVDFQIELVQILPTFEAGIEVKRYGLKCKRKTGNVEAFDRICDRIFSLWRN